MRHAEAAKGEPDELRPLTAEGKAQARSLARELARAGVAPDAIVTSPLLRARETAAILGRELDVVPEPDERLAPGAGPEAFAEAAQGRGATVVAVGHQPDCSLAAAALTGAEVPAFAPAAAFAVDLPR